MNNPTASAVIDSHPTIIDIGKAQVMVVISSPSPMISVPCLSLVAKGFDYGLFKRCSGNSESLSPVCDLSMASPMLGLVKHLQSSLLWQEPAELMMTRPSFEGACLRMELSHRFLLVHTIALGLGFVLTFLFLCFCYLCLLPLVNSVFTSCFGLAWLMFLFISFSPRVVTFFDNPSGLYQGLFPCVYLDFGWL
ncbi:hypothetical protein V6N13_047069 [Hibiscus sabdariffa]